MRTSWYIVSNPKTGRLIELLNEDEACQPYVGWDYVGHCGGCDSCMLMQAQHAGMKVECLELESGETLGDGLGRINALFDAQEPKLVSHEKGEHDTWSDVYGRMAPTSSHPLEGPREFLSRSRAPSAWPTSTRDSTSCPGADPTQDP